MVEIRLGNPDSKLVGSTLTGEQARELTEPVVITVSALLADARALVVSYERLLADIGAARGGSIGRPGVLDTFDADARAARQVVAGLVERSVVLAERVDVLREGINLEGQA